MRIVQRESPLALYKGLGAVTAGIVPKMAIRFTTFQFYKDVMVDKDGKPWKLNNLWGKFIFDLDNQNLYGEYSVWRREGPKRGGDETAELQEWENEKRPRCSRE